MSEHAIRLEKLRGKLAGLGLDGALITHFTDIYYFAGTRQNGVLWVPVSGQAVLLVRKSLIKAQAESSGVEVRPFAGKTAFLEAVPAGPLKAGLVFNGLSAQLFKFYSGIMKGAEFSDISAAVRDLRAVKSAAELELARESGRRLGSVFSSAPSFLKPGMNELEAAAAFEYHSRLAGNEGCRMRAPIGENFIGVAVAGGSGAIPGYFDGAVTGPGLSSASPVGASLARVGRDAPLFLDYTFMHAGYITDMTRLFVFGRLPEKLAKAYAVSVEIHDEISAGLKAGAIGEELYLKALSMAEKAGLAENFMGVTGEQAKFVGHGVGLELDEMPVLCMGAKAPLEAGSVVALEPKFIFPGLGAVGVENTFIVGASGPENITGKDTGIVHL